jgi:hypothetical protein
MKPQLIWATGSSSHTLSATPVDRRIYMEARRTRYQPIIFDTPKRQAIWLSLGALETL